MSKSNDSRLLGESRLCPNLRTASFLSAAMHRGTIYPTNRKTSWPPSTKPTHALLDNSYITRTITFPRSFHSHLIHAIQQS